MRWFLLFLEWLMDWARGTYWYLCGKRTGLCKGTLSPPGPMIFDQRKRKQVLRQEFDKYEVPQKLDAIVIGSGVGGLTAAAVLAKLGKKVLVLEQNDQAGGLCQTFTKEGFEFDSAFHFVGQVHENSILKIAFDQITDGQLRFAELDPHVDTVVIGTGKRRKEYTIFSGKRQMEAHLKKQFPNDTKAIEEFFKIMKICSTKIHLLCDLKLVPLWFARFILWSGIADWISPIFKYSRTSTLEMISSLTDNKDLLTVLSHICYGVPPKDSSGMITALFLHHSKRGSFYPVGGASEIPYHIIPVIQKAGGKVLVKAPVSRILVDKSGSAYGVTVKTTDEEVEIRAPVIISNAGLLTTFHKLLPPEIKMEPEVVDCLENVKPGRGFFQVFAGFNATQEELGITSTSYRLYKSNNMDTALEDYFSLDEEDAPDNIPMMFMSFPSAKDPTSKSRFPGQSRMMIHTVVNAKWFGKWKGIPEEDRGEDFKEFKMRFANHLFDWACVHFPKLREKLVMLHAVSPINKHAGAILSAEHNLERFQPLTIAKTRSTTPIKNLYLSGQDVFSAGVSGAVHGGLLCASSVLGHVVYIDLLLQQKKLKKNVVKKTE
ncbi:inactive all-trans-retinol 13,14-reductase-like [Colossoma macropomum]|uniref:inactive all-trans-retinol 13,14-reductase-like n=1 Tax=Colossoma macropomum TaxID=42526 RepID=UPI001864220F|nr:inactive all-trans-retinol 13,14-reductase-like [Colossoma macropomum]